MKISVVDDEEFRFNDVSNHEGHLRQNGVLKWCISSDLMTYQTTRVICVKMVY